MQPDTGGIPELEFVDYTAHVARCEILRHATRESCILTARLLSHIYFCLGIKSIPIAVGVRTMNAYTRAHYADGFPYDPSDENLFTVGVDHEYTSEEDWTETGWWPGHLCLVVAGKYLVDPSCDQMSWPERGIVLAPFAVELDDAGAFFMGSAGAEVKGQAGQASYYKGYSDDTHYMKSTDWYETVPGGVYHETVVPKVRALMETIIALRELPGKPTLPESISMRGDRGEASPKAIETARKGIEDLAETARQLGVSLDADAEAARRYLALASSQPSSP